MTVQHHLPRPLNKSASQRGFSLVEVLVVVAVIGLLAAILLPALTKARDRAQGILCMNNTRQLQLAWRLYAGDNDDWLPYNIPVAGSSFRTNLNWVNNVMTWDLSPDNTNTVNITDASLGLFNGGDTAIYHCPSDCALSPQQIQAGWSQRIRSYSMNSMMGDPGPFTNNYGFTRFYKLAQIPNPSDMFVFLDEHPDSINDGCFQDAGTFIGRGPVWTDLPASYHNRAAAFSFSDGHAALHRWQLSETIRPPVPHGANLPISIPTTSAAKLADLEWVTDHMSIEKN